MLNKTREILADLVAFPTISTESNLDIIQYIDAYLKPLGADIKIWPDETGKKANLFATLGPNIDGGMVFSGHTDVVPVEGQEWTNDPFQMVLSKDRLIGRGTCDMKGFVATVLALAPKCAALDLKRPLHFAFTHDEEIGCIGAKALTKEIAKLDIHPSIAIIGEPTGMRVIEGHKGCSECTTEFFGFEGHGSQPNLGVNAVEYAIRFASQLSKIGKELQNQASETSRYDPPWTTVQVGSISGGVTHNIIPSYCKLDWEMRAVQKGDNDRIKEAIHDYATNVLLPQMRGVFPEANIITHVKGDVAALEVEENNKAVDVLTKLTGDTETDVVAFGTEASLFQAIGISSVVCGPGSIKQAHKPDEFILISEIEKALDLYWQLCKRLEFDL